MHNYIKYGIYNTFSDLIIGNDVITADRISFVTNIRQYDNIAIPIKNQPSTSDKIVIDDGTWIGMNVTILAGTHIGKNCVVAAHNVVKGNYPDFCVIGGHLHVSLNNRMKKLENGKNMSNIKIEQDVIFI